MNRNLPQKIKILHWAYSLDGGTIELDGVTESNEEFSVRLNQYMFLEEIDDPPGRLYFNNQLVPIRSEQESVILDLLRTAEIAVQVDDESDGDKLSNSENTLILSQDIKDVLEDDPLETAIDFVNSIVDFVQSDLYLEVAKSNPTA